MHNVEEDNSEEEESELDNVLEEEPTETEEETKEVEEIDEEQANDEQTEEKQQPIVINFGSGEIEVNDINELQQIASKALRDKTKYEKYKDDIALIEGIKENGLSEEDLYLLVEAKKGNKKAIAKFLKETGIDPLDIELDEEELKDYKPNEYKSDMKLIETKTIIDNLKTDKEAFTKFNNLITNEFDEDSRAKVFQDPTLLEFIGESIKSGLYEKIAPKYMKRKLLGENPISAFIGAYDEYTQSLQNQQKQQIEQKVSKEKEKATKRKKASIGSKEKSKTSKKDKVDFSKMSDEEFEEYYRNLVGYY
jgi:hypothetical protein